MGLLFTHCLCTVYVLKNIKNWSHDTIHVFKNYFVTVLSVFSFQFSVSATISSIQTNPYTFPESQKRVLDFSLNFAYGSMLGLGFFN